MAFLSRGKNNPSIIRRTCTIDSKIRGFSGGWISLSAYVERGKNFFRNFQFFPKLPAFFVENQWIFRCSMLEKCSSYIVAIARFPDKSKNSIFRNQFPPQSGIILAFESPPDVFGACYGSDSLWSRLIKPNIIKPHLTSATSYRIISIAEADSNSIDMSKTHPLVCKLLKVDSPFSPSVY